MSPEGVHRACGCVKVGGVFIEQAGVHVTCMVGTRVCRNACMSVGNLAVTVLLVMTLLGACVWAMGMSPRQWTCGPVGWPCRGSMCPWDYGCVFVCDMWEVATFRLGVRRVFTFPREVLSQTWALPLHSFSQKMNA